MDILLVCGRSSCVRWLYNPNNQSDTYQAWCDEDGWTLAMKVDGTSGVLGYSSSYWTDDQLLNSGVSDMDVSAGGDAKFRAFTTAPGVAVRLMMRTATTGSSFGSPVDLYTGSFTSLRALFNGPTVTTSTAKSTWLSILPGGISYQDNCNLQGVNVQVVSGVWGYSYYRLGIWFNDEPGCRSCDSGVGVGGEGVYRSHHYGSSEAFYYGYGLTSFSNVFIKQCAAGQVAISTAPFCSISGSYHV